MSLQTQPYTRTRSVLQYFSIKNRRHAKKMPTSDPPLSANMKAGRRPLTLFDLPMEIHLTISSFLPTSAIAILALVPGLRNFYCPGKPLDWTPVELGYARELVTRTDMERIITPHINKRKGLFDLASLHPDVLDKLLKCRLLCMACGEQYPVTHFPVKEIVLGIKREGHAKIAERKCIGMYRHMYLSWFRGGKMTWKKLEEARQELLRKAERLNGHGDITAEPILHTRALEVPLPRPDQNRRLMVDVRSLDPKPGIAKSSRYGLGIYFPEPYIRLHAQPYGDSSSHYVSYAHTESHMLLGTKWSESLHVNLLCLGTVFFFKFLFTGMCPHMDGIGYMGRSDVEGHIEQSMFRCLVTGLHSKDLAWEDSLFENGEVVKKVKRMISSCKLCYKGGCDTEVVLERIMYRVKKGDDGADSNGSGQSNGTGDGKKKTKLLAWHRQSKNGEQWKEFVIATVRRHWIVATPSDRQWQLQTKSCAKRAEKHGGWRNVVVGPSEYFTGWWMYETGDTRRGVVDAIFS